MSDNENKNVDPMQAPFFYKAKASRSERDKGCEHLFWKYEKGSYEKISQEEYEKLENEKGVRVASGNIHPTVKPVDVMEWLINRLSDNPDDVILDPFAGSGTTGIAAMKAQRSCHLIELNEEETYRHVIEGRMHGWREEILDEVPPHLRPEIKFEGALPDENPNEIPDAVSVGSLFGSF